MLAEPREANRIGDPALNRTADADTPSSLSFSPSGSFLASTAWDSKLKVHDISSGAQRSSLTFGAPLLDARWVDESHIVTGGCDRTLHKYNVETGDLTIVGEHDEPIQAVRTSEDNMIITAGWDSKIKYWDHRTPGCVGSVDLDDKIYAMDCRGKTVVAATASRTLAIINLSDPMVLFRSLQSPLRHQTTCVCVYSGTDGFAVGSIEGRCAIRFAAPGIDATKAFAFKCHRQHGSDVFSVNDIAWHPTYPHSFATVGADSTLAFWDKDKKQRLKNYPSASTGITKPIVCCQWDDQGEKFAYAVGYDWSRGPEGMDSTPNCTDIFIHQTIESELTRR